MAFKMVCASVDSMNLKKVN